MAILGPVTSTARQRIASASYFAEIKDALLDGADLTDVTVERVVGWPAN